MKFEYINMDNEKVVNTASLIKDVDLAAMIMTKRPEQIKVRDRNQVITELTVAGFVYVRLNEDYWIYFTDREDLLSIRIDFKDFVEGYQSNFYLGFTDGVEYHGVNSLDSSIKLKSATMVIALPATGMSLSGLSYVLSNTDELVNNFARFYVKANAHFYQMKLTCTEAKKLCDIVVDMDVPEKIIDRVGEAIINLEQYTRSAKVVKEELSKTTINCYSEIMRSVVTHYRDLLDELAKVDEQRNKLVRELEIAKAEFLNDVCQDYQQTRTSKVGKPHIVVFRGTKR